MCIASTFCELPVQFIQSAECAFSQSHFHTDMMLTTNRKGFAKARLKYTNYYCIARSRAGAYDYHTLGIALPTSMFQ